MNHGCHSKRSRNQEEDTLSSLFDRMTILNLVEFFPANIIGNVAASSSTFNVQLDTPMAWKLRCVRYIKVPAVDGGNLSLSEWKQLARSISRYKFVGFSTPMPLTRLQKIASASEEISLDEKMTDIHHNTSCFCVQLGDIDRTFQDYRDQDCPSATIAVHRAEENVEFDGDPFGLFLELEQIYRELGPAFSNDDPERWEDEGKSVSFIVSWRSPGNLPPYDGFEGLGPTQHGHSEGAWTAVGYQAHYLVSSQQSPIAGKSYRATFGAVPEALGGACGAGQSTPQNLVAAVEATTEADPVILFFRIRSFRSEPSVLRPHIIAGRSSWEDWSSKWKDEQLDGEDN